MKFMSPAQILTSSVILLATVLGSGGSTAGEYEITATVENPGGGSGQIIGNTPVSSSLNFSGWRGKSCIGINKTERCILGGVKRNDIKEITVFFEAPVVASAPVADSFERNPYYENRQPDFESPATPNFPIAPDLPSTPVYESPINFDTGTQNIGHIGGSSDDLNLQIGVGEIQSFVFENRPNLPVVDIVKKDVEPRLGPDWGSNFNLEPVTKTSDTPNVSGQTSGGGEIPQSKSFSFYEDTAFKKNNLDFGKPVFDPVEAINKVGEAYDAAKEKVGELADRVTDNAADVVKYLNETPIAKEAKQALDAALEPFRNLISAADNVINSPIDWSQLRADYWGAGNEDYQGPIPQSDKKSEGFFSWLGF